MSLDAISLAIKNTVATTVKSNLLHESKLETAGVVNHICGGKHGRQSGW